MAALRVIALLGCALAGAVQLDSSSGSSESVAIMHSASAEPTLIVSVSVCVGILGIVMITAASRLRPTTASSSLLQRMRPVVVVGAFFAHCLWLHNAVLVQNVFHSREYCVEILMTMAVVWWISAFLHEIWVKKAPLCEEKEDFVAGDVYSDLSMSMFYVTVRFMMQASMLLIVIHVAQETVDSGPAENVSNIRRLINFSIALTIVLFMFVSFRDQSSWEDVMRLRGVRAIKLLKNEGCAFSKVEVVYVAPGDFYIRFAMSVVTTGIFHMFLVLYYPMLVFTTFARDSWVVLLKDILAITIVTQLDTLMKSVSFKVFNSVAAANEDEG